MRPIGIGLGVGFIAGAAAGVTPVAAWDASTSTLAQLAALVSHSRTSLATMFDSTGKLTYAPNNLLTYSNTFSNAAWAKNNSSVGGTTPGPNGLTGTLIVPSAINAAHSVSQSVTTSSNAIIWAIAKGDGTYSALSVASTPNNYVHFNLTNGAVSTIGAGWASGGTTSLGSGWYLCWAVQQTSTNFANALFYALDTFIANGNTGPVMTGDGVHGIYIAATGVSAVTYETSPRTADQVITTSSAYYGPRIDYDPNTLAVKGLLIEEARTNRAINSASLSSFSPFSMTATTNFAVAPDGTSAATKLDDGTTAAVPHQVAYSPSGLSASTAYAFSVFAKQGTGRYLTLSNVGSSSADGGYAVFDLQAGTVTQSAALGAGSLTSATITPINGGWYRLSVVTVAGTNTARFLFVLGSNSGTYTADSNGRNSYTGTNNTWLVWGAQLELGSFATSYIPDAAAAVTRAADALAAALYSSNPSILQVRNLSTGVRSRKKLTTFSSVSSELNEWIEAFRVYPVGTSSAYLDAHLTVDGSW